MPARSLRRLIVFSACVAVLCSPVLAQKISIGVVGGGALTDGFGTQFFPFEFPPGVTPDALGERDFASSKDYLIGGTLEYRFTPHLSVEGDGIFRELHMARAAVLIDGTLNSVSPSPVITWEFPILAKYRTQRWKVNPFIEAGPSFRTAGNLNGTDPSHIGVTGGLGIELNVHGIKIAPTVRYTHWERDPGRYRPFTDPNQFELILGLSHETKSAWRPSGEHFSLGVALGTNLTGDWPTVEVGVPDDFENPPTRISSGPRKLIVGPSAEVKFPRHISVEADALYHLISQSYTSDLPDGTVNHYTGDAVTWEFPVLAKYRFQLGSFKPFLGAGPSFRLPQVLGDASNYGVVTAAGLQFSTRYLNITPSIRYTHWSSNGPFGGPVRNQTALLVGISF